ncbi:MAG: hypothetical protein BSOLF_0092 [Candidatus Carbobacillus altaicus]|uniref:Uncharacterized protein n=1 Tax=Candidatus Carbonibacillus altaicus TaxID=2163959 RepID=A0A2R6Y1J5_9BACL|nr:MAG: hypothetical protein BSOLF_0092 [Candidatus Carbobacillus altaicus]
MKKRRVQAAFFMDEVLQFFSSYFQKALVSAFFMAYNKIK